MIVTCVNGKHKHRLLPHDLTHTTTTLHHGALGDDGLVLGLDEERRKRPSSSHA